MEKLKYFRTTYCAAGVLGAVLLLSGCASTISVFHKGPIKQDPGNVSLGTSLNDSSLGTIADVNIGKASKSLDSSHLVPVVYNGDILLVGQVPTAADKVQAGSVVKNIKGIKKVFNELEVSPNTTYLTRSSDAWLTSKIKTKMIATSELPSGKIKIVTENGVVYLMGLVTHATAEKAVSVAKDTDGVQKIVTVFDYLD